MSIKRPDLYEHQNPDLAIVDSDGVRGGRRVATDRAALYALASKADQLKEQVTVVRVLSEGLNLRLVDATQIGSAAGWEPESSGTGGTPYNDAELRSRIEGLEEDVDQLEQDVTRIDNEVDTLDQRVDTIESVIPSNATPTNKLVTVADLPPPGSGGGGGSQRGTYFSLPGVYEVGNTQHELAAGVVDVDVVFGSGRTLQPVVDYTLNTTPAKPVLTLTADLSLYSGETVWGRTYRTLTRTYFPLPDAYGAGYAPVVLSAGTFDVDVVFGSGRPLQPGVDYTFDQPTRTLTLLADADLYGGETLWLWLYS